MIQYLFRFEEGPDLTTPFPVLTGEDGGLYSGRSDAHSLVGFQAGMKPQVSRSFEDAVRDPRWIRGKFPVFQYAFDEGLFVLLERIESVEVIERVHLGIPLGI